MTERHVRSVTSLQNERVKAIRALDMRKARKETRLFVAEGAAILVTARERGFRPETLVYQAGAAREGIHRGLVAWALAAGAEVLEVSEAVLQKLAAKDNLQAMLATFAQRWASPPDPARLAADAVWLALEEVRDLGNLGTIIRTVEAVGAAGVILIGACCDPYARECVRATMGSIFGVPLVRIGPRFSLGAPDGRARSSARTCRRARGLPRALLPRPRPAAHGERGAGLCSRWPRPARGSSRSRWRATSTASTWPWPRR